MSHGSVNQAACSTLKQSKAYRAYTEEARLGACMTPHCPRCRGRWLPGPRGHGPREFDPQALGRQKAGGGGGHWAGPPARFARQGRGRVRGVRAAGAPGGDTRRLALQGAGVLSPWGRHPRGPFSPLGAGHIGLATTSVPAGSATSSSRRVSFADRDGCASPVLHASSEVVFSSGPLSWQGRLHPTACPAGA